MLLVDGGRLQATPSLCPTPPRVPPVAWRVGPERLSLVLGMGESWACWRCPRSIGDGQYKRCGVTSVPDIRRCQLTPNDR